MRSNLKRSLWPRLWYFARPSLDCVYAPLCNVTATNVTNHSIGLTTDTEVIHVHINWWHHRNERQGSFTVFT